MNQNFKFFHWLSNASKPAHRAPRCHYDAIGSRGAHVCATLIFKILTVPFVLRLPSRSLHHNVGTRSPPPLRPTQHGRPFSNEPCQTPLFRLPQHRATQHRNNTPAPHDTQHRQRASFSTCLAAATVPTPLVGRAPKPYGANNPRPCAPHGPALDVVTTQFALHKLLYLSQYILIFENI